MTTTESKKTAENLWDVTRLAGSLGAEVRGINLAQATDTDITKVQRLLNQHMVLFFPAQFLSEDEHVAFGAHFGPLEGHPNLTNADSHPKLFELRASQGGVADEWHTDITFQEQPALMSILKMVKVTD